MYVVTKFAWLHNIVEPLTLQTFWIVFADLCTSSLDDPNDLQTLMDALRASISNQEIQRFSIDLQELWEDSIATTFKSPKFNETYAPRVKFQGEAGIDAGGLSRESTSYPGSFTCAWRSSKDPGWSWSRDSLKIRYFIGWGKYQITCFHIQVIHFKCKE